VCYLPWPFGFVGELRTPYGRTWWSVEWCAIGAARGEAGWGPAHGRWVCVKSGGGVSYRDTEVVGFRSLPAR